MKNGKEKKVLSLEFVGMVVVSACIFFLIFYLGGVEKYTVSFNSVGGTHITSERVRENEKITKPVNPSRDGYSFVGWYVEDTLFDFNTVVNSNIELVAKWEKNVGENISKDEQVKINLQQLSLVLQKLQEIGEKFANPVSP